MNVLEKKKHVNFNKLTKELTPNQENALTLHLLKKRGLDLKIEGGNIELVLAENLNEKILGYFVDYLVYKSEAQLNKQGVLVK